MAADYSFARKEKAQVLQSLANQPFPKKDGLTCACYNNATLLPAKVDNSMPFGLGGVLSENNEYLAESGIAYRFGGFYEPTGRIYRNERIVYCGYLVHHWGHFLIEAVTRLWYFLSDDDAEIDKYVFVGNLDGSTEPTGNYKEFFELLGIADKLEIINRPTQYREVILPEMGYKRGTHYSEEFNQIFEVVSARALQRPCERSFPPKVFLSRRRFAAKEEIGLDMLDDFFERNGYEIVYPEMVSLTELVHCLRHAEICAAESGTLPHNFLFAEKEKTVVIIERQDIPNEIQVDVDRMRNLSVYYVDGYYTIYPGGKPHYLSYSTCMRQWANAWKLQPPGEAFFTERYKKRCVAKYMKLYRAEHGYRWDVQRWELSWGPMFYDSYKDALNEIGDYLSEKKLFKIWQLFEIRMIKIVVKRVLNKVKSRCRKPL